MELLISILLLVLVFFILCYIWIYFELKALDKKYEKLGMTAHKRDWLFREKKGDR